MGGQACVLYGAAEFSRDLDLAILTDKNNFKNFQNALNVLQASPIAIPQFDKKYLELGLAIHFRCKHPDVNNLRIDIMSKMRGVDAFEFLWKRRTTFSLGNDNPLDVLSLPDLVKAKKTQREKDWPMISRLIEVNYFENRDSPNDEQLEFWFTEMRTPSILIELASLFPDHCNKFLSTRPLLIFALDNNNIKLSDELDKERKSEIEADQIYWKPLKKKLIELKSQRFKK